MDLRLDWLQGQEGNREYRRQHIWQRPDFDHTEMMAFKLWNMLFNNICNYLFAHVSENLLSATKRRP